MVLLPGCACCVSCPAIIPAQQQSSWPFSWNSYDVPQSVTVSITFDHPGEVLVIENRKTCCPTDPVFVTSARGLLITKPTSGTYSLSPTGFPGQYEYVSATLFLRATLSQQIDRVNPPSVPAGQQPCAVYGSLLIIFGRNAQIIRTANATPVAQMTEAELRAAVQAGTNQVLSNAAETLSRYCRTGVPDPAFATTRCKTGTWDELWRNPGSTARSRFSEGTSVPFSFPVAVPGIGETLSAAEALDPCTYCWAGEGYPCTSPAPAPPNCAPEYFYNGTTLINRVWQGPESSAVCTVTINSILAHTAGQPDKKVLDI